MALVYYSNERLLTEEYVDIGKVMQLNSYYLFLPKVNYVYQLQ